MDDLKKFHKAVSTLLTSGKREPEFFELVRRFEQHCPELPRMGYARRSDEDVLHFGQNPCLHFAETEINSLQEEPGGLMRLLVNFFGLCCINGPMPLEFTSLVFQRSHNHYDHTLQRFLDIINHPFLRLYYRAWADHSPAVCYDRPRQNLHGKFLRALTGQPDILAKHSAVLHPWLSKCSYTTNPCRSRSGLFGLLSEQLHLPIHLEERIPGEFQQPKQYLCHIGQPTTAMLGRNTQIGQHFISNTRKINIHFGPLTFKQYVPILPGQPLFHRTASMIVQYLNQPIEFDFVFRLKSQTLPIAKLNGRVALSRSAWLGHVSTQETSVHLDSFRLLEYQHHQQQSAFSCITKKEL